MGAKGPKGEVLPIGMELSQQLRHHLREGNYQVTNVFNQMKEMSQITAQGLGERGIETIDEKGTRDQINEAWTRALLDLSARDDYESPFQILKKMELFNKVYRAAFDEYRQELYAATRNDAAGTMGREEGLIGHNFGTRYPDEPAPTKPASYWGAETALKLHYPRMNDDENKIVNSRGSQLAVADYELDFVKQVMTMPTVKGMATAQEVADTKYYYAVVNLED